MKAATRFTSLAILLLGAADAARGDLISWNTWTSDSSGSMMVNSTPVTVSFATDNFHADISNYPSWNPSSSYADGKIVSNAPAPSNGIMQLTGSTDAVNTLSFSTAVVNPVLALWSLGQTGDPVSFVFGETPTFVAGGPSAEYVGSAITVSGNTVSGSEGNGTVEFLGTFSSITWTNPQSEYWYGFNVGAPSAAVAVPEPSNFLVMLAGGAAGLVMTRSLRRK